MTDKVQLIKEEIERLKNEQLSIFSKGENDEICSTALICIGVYNQLLSFINSLSEEPKCIYNRTLDERKKFYKYCSAACDVRIEEEPETEDLIEEIDKIWKTCNPIDEGMGVETANIHIEQFDDIARHFAEWQKQEMMKDAVEGTVKYEIGSAEIPQCDRRYQVLSDQVHIPNAKLGDKVKIIILKTE